MPSFEHITALLQCRMYSEALGLTPVTHTATLPSAGAAHIHWREPQTTVKLELRAQKLKTFSYFSYMSLSLFQSC